MAEISASVGTGGINHDDDVRIVQALLNNYVTALGLKALGVDGGIGDKTITAIRAFQRKIVGLAKADGRVDPDGKTMRHLNATIASITPQAAADPANLSGADWWHANEARFGNSRSVLDLEPAFQADVARFIAALRAGGATVGISSTRRNKIRAYLMHFSFRLAKGEVRAADIPPEPGCTIQWDHGDTAKSQAAARAMRDLFNIAFKPSLTSRHIAGRAIDMTIRWAGTINVRDANGQLRPVGSPRDDSNPALHRIGQSYGVIKLISDPPHWSDDGH